MVVDTKQALFHLKKGTSSTLTSVPNQTEFTAKLLTVDLCYSVKTQ